jgi:AcrR family transcriptional regulator
MLTSVNRKRGDDPLPAAVALLRRDGPGALTMRNVAAEAGVTATALYRHYADRDALIAAVVRDVYGVFRRWLVVPIGTGEPATWLRLAFDRFLHFALEHPNYYRLLFLEPHGHGIDRYPADFAAGRSSTFRQLRDVVEHCMAAGVLRPADATDVALTVYAHMHGLIALHLAGRFPDPAEFARFYHRSMESLVAGIGGA